MPNVYNHGTILVTAGYDGTVRFWDAATAKCCRTVMHQKSQANRMAILRARSQLAVAGNPFVLLYDLAGKSTSELATIEGHRGNVTALGYDRIKGDWLFTASEDASLRIWDLRGDLATALDTRTTSSVYAAAIHPAQTAVIAGDQDGKVYTWDLRAQALSSVKLDGGMSVRALAVRFDGRRVAVATNTGRIVVYACDEVTGGGLTEVANWPAHATYILQVAFSPDGSVLATASADHTVKLWAKTDAAGERDKESYSLWRTLVGHQRWVWDCVFNSDGEYLLTGSSDNTAKLWRLSNGEVERQFNGHQKAISCVALSEAM